MSSNKKYLGILDVWIRIHLYSRKSENEIVFFCFEAAFFFDAIFPFKGHRGWMQISRDIRAHNTFCAGRGRPTKYCERWIEHFD